MATTKGAMASSLLILLAAILLATASVQARHDSLPPPPAEAPAPVQSAGGQCTLEGIAEVGVCMGLIKLQSGVLGRTSTAARDLCCQRIRGKPIADAVACLCTVFWPFNARDRAEVADDVNAVLTVCGEPHVPDPVCLQGKA